MTLAEHLQKDAHNALHGPAWHGPSVLEILKDVTAEQAANYPLENTHSIWEIVLHMITWKRIGMEAIDGTPVPTAMPEVDWPPMPLEPSEQAWQKTIGRLTALQDAFAAQLARLDDASFENPAPGRDYSFFVLLNGIIQHDLYHAGQIVMLKKMLR